MKNKISAIFLSLSLFFVFAVNAFAAINSVSDIEAKKTKISTIVSSDYSKFYNKTEIIGNRLNMFQMNTEKYKSEVQQVESRLNRIIEQINFIQSADIPGKEVEIKKLYQDAEDALQDIDSKTLQYLSTVRTGLPTLTYNKFVKNFINFYNGVNISNKTLRYN